MDSERDGTENIGQAVNDNTATETVGKSAPIQLSETASPAEAINRVTLDIARLIGRQMARDDYEHRTAANDNDAGGVSDGDEHDHDHD